MAKDDIQVIIIDDHNFNRCDATIEIMAVGELTR
ncbi:hypothetical protein ES703_117818 [subsurface metagenome]